MNPLKSSQIQDQVLSSAYKQRAHTWQLIKSENFTSAITPQELLTACYDLKSLGHLKSVAKEFANKEEGAKIRVRISAEDKTRGEQMGW